MQGDIFCEKYEKSKKRQGKGFTIVDKALKK